MAEEKKGCEYCGRPGQKRAGPEDGLPYDVYACGSCWKLLQNPATAIPLLRGHLSLEMRGVVEKKEAEGLVSSFIGKVAGWRPRPPSS